MTTLIIENANINLIDGNIVLFEADPDIVVDKTKAQNFYQEIEQQGWKLSSLPLFWYGSMFYICVN